MIHSDESPTSPAGSPFLLDASSRPPRSEGSTSGRLPELISPQQETAAFWRLRLRLTRRILLETLATARLRLCLVLVLSSFLWLGLFWLFDDAFRFLSMTIPSPELHQWTVQKIFSAFFFTLMAMLVFSSGIILYGAMFRSPDIPLLLTLPARAERVFLVKFQEALVMSSWAFLLLGSPMLVAYGIVARSPWYYYVLLAPFLVAFTYIPAALGAMACMLAVYFLREVKTYIIGGTIMAGIGLLVLIGWTITSGESNLLTPDWFQEMLNRLAITEHRLFPSWWLSTGLLEAAGGSRVASTGVNYQPWTESLMFLALMISNALFLRLVALSTAGRIYRAAYSRLNGSVLFHRRTRSIWLDRFVFRITRGLSLQIRLLLVKDVRLFRRDPIQWSQILIFTGLLILYFVNVRRFRYDVYYVSWVNVVSFLNVSVVGLLLSTFTTRFVFPMVSLEGHRFWFLGLLPLHRNTILWSKFLFAVGASLMPSSLLILLSDLMLHVSLMILLSHQLTCLILCLGLSGIAVGLGAKMVNLREQSPSRIAAGFGGTLNLVISTMYIVAVVLMTGVPSHFYLGFQSPVHEGPTGLPSYVTDWLGMWMFAGTGASILLGAIATVVPMAIGFRAFRDLEFQ